MVAQAGREPSGETWGGLRRARVLSRRALGEPASGQEIAEAVNAQLWECTRCWHDFDAYHLAKMGRGVIGSSTASSATSTASPRRRQHAQALDLPVTVVWPEGAAREGRDVLPVC